LREKNGKRTDIREQNNPNLLPSWGVSSSCSCTPEDREVSEVFTEAGGFGISTVTGGGGFGISTEGTGSFDNSVLSTNGVSIFGSKLEDW